MKKKIGIALIVVLALAQFITIQKKPGDINPENDFLVIEQAPEEVAQLMKAACYDCHSNSTNYPWYSNVAPVSWWLKRHVDNGSSKLNYSEWSGYNEGTREHKREESADYVGKGWMPIGPYKLAHPEARLTDEQRKLLVDWLNPNE
tara:strand:+ start:70 stop:507 length:438 start_codon:yes stop_codon:yes gene_type:complete